MHGTILNIWGSVSPNLDFFVNSVVYYIACLLTAPIMVQNHTHTYKSKNIRIIEIVRNMPKEKHKKTERETNSTDKHKDRSNTLGTGRAKSICGPIQQLKHIVDGTWTDSAAKMH